MEGLTLNFERSSTVGEMLSNSVACYPEIICKRSVNRCGKLHCCLVIFLNVYFERERQSTSKGGAQREGNTESEAGSRL